MDDHDVMIMVGDDDELVVVCVSIVVMIMVDDGFVGLCRHCCVGGGK
jgi:hypothetical protein